MVLRDLNIILVVMMRYVLIAVLLISPASAADPPKLPDGYACEAVRAKVAEHGWLVAYAWAKLQGYSKEQIAAAKKCLR